MLYGTRYMVASAEFRMGHTLIRPGDLFGCTDTDRTYLTRNHRAKDYEGKEPAPEQLVWRPPQPAAVVPVVEHGESQRPAPGVVTASTWSPETPEDQKATTAVSEVQVGTPSETTDKAPEKAAEGEDTSEAPIAPQKPVFTPSRTLPRTAVGGRSGRSSGNKSGTGRR